ncbi:GPN-loop GTPase 1 [Condylostylus longicornis]|uniref:GPN-loop GTPase 1 n=1 Tax=Condylostylus longicornis TaxID=2530218 RepID=UPI00244E0A84|nr:GPN-loop GTPase 1 [Condylostylus longicornis]
MSEESISKNSPVCIIVLGMAGSGKTTFVKKLHQLVYDSYKPYVINLDPACLETPYHANIDIRDTVNYKEVMSQYKLGPNGGIVTSLNLFATKFDKVIELLGKAFENGQKLCIVDTPGQVEVFTWSASGTIITEALATSFCTIIVYVMDVVRSRNPVTFISNMLYACSILYKARLPFIIVLNKIDIEDCSFAIEWMKDFEVFHEALEKEQTFVSNLARTMSLTLDEFYRDLKSCGLSSKTGIGFDKLFELITECSKEYESDYKKELKKLELEKSHKFAKQLVSDVTKNSSIGAEVPMASFVENYPNSNVSEVYLKHPGNESSDDEEGVENKPVAYADDQLEEENFNDYLEKRKLIQKDKMKL